jgi:hypothetical protein
VTTAHVHYRPGNPTEPEYVLIDGARNYLIPPDWNSDTPYTLGAVNAACLRIGWRVMGDARIVRRSDGTGTVRVEPVDATIHTAVPATPYTDWRDVPTMVSISDDAAAALNELSTTLGIDGDELASAWIIRAAVDARYNHTRWSAPGYIADHTRIKGWAPAGYPYLDTLPNYPRHGYQPRTEKDT